MSQHEQLEFRGCPRSGEARPRSERCVHPTKSTAAVSPKTLVHDDGTPTSARLPKPPATARSRAPWRGMPPPTFLLRRDARSTHASTERRGEERGHETTSSAVDRVRESRTLRRVSSPTPSGGDLAEPCPFEAPLNGARFQVTCGSSPPLGKPGRLAALQKGDPCSWHQRVTQVPNPEFSPTKIPIQQFFARMLAAADLGGPDVPSPSD